MPEWVADDGMLTYYGTETDARRIWAQQWRSDQNTGVTDPRTINGSASSLTVRASTVSVYAPQEQTFTRIDERWSATTESEYLLVFEGHPRVQCSFDGRPTIERKSDTTVTVTAEQRATLTLTGWSEPRVLDKSRRIPPTLSGVQGIVNDWADTMAAIGPDRSVPSVRRSVRCVRIDADAPTPDPNRDGELAISVPSAIEPILVCAPLAYYLGIPIRLNPNERAWLGRTDGSWSFRLGRMPTLPATVLGVLRRLLVLDAYVRTAGTHPAPTNARAWLNAIGLDAHQLFHDPEADRLETYLSLDEATLASTNIDWPLTTYLPGTIEAVRALPFVLTRLSAVALPRAGELDDAARIKRALETYWRGTRSRVPVVDAEVTESRYHAWIGAGVPIEVATMELETAAAPHSMPKSVPRIALVENDAEMADEASTIRRRPCPSLRIERFRGLTQTELREVVAGGFDYVHYVGHCNTDGLECIDGHWSIPDELADPPTSFCLNACQSYDEGRTLIAAGSRAGAVTFAPVVDGEAAKVGRSFLELLLAGVSVERALALARREILMGQEYGILGDPTHRLRGGNPAPSPIVRAQRTQDGGLDIEVDTTGTHGPGRTVPGPFDRTAMLAESTAEQWFSLAEGWTWLRSQPHPIVLDGTLWLPGALAADPNDHEFEEST